MLYWKKVLKNSSNKSANVSQWVTFALKYGDKPLETNFLFIIFYNSVDPDLWEELAEIFGFYKLEKRDILRYIHAMCDFCKTLWHLSDIVR